MASVGLRADGILVYRYKSGVRLSLEHAQEVVERAAELVDHPRPTLILMGGVRQIVREARTFFASAPENQAVSSHAALVVGSPVSSLIGNFFMGLNQTAFPTRLFTSEDDAVAWLQGFLV